jgi:hypothetical protein
MRGRRKPKHCHNETDVSVPLAHQSALAGILLASALVIDRVPELRALRPETSVARYDVLHGGEQHLPCPRERRDPASAGTRTIRPPMRTVGHDEDADRVRSTVYVMPFIGRLESRVPAQTSPSSRAAREGGLRPHAGHASSGSAHGPPEGEEPAHIGLGQRQDPAGRERELVELLGAAEPRGETVL